MVGRIRWISSVMLREVAASRAPTSCVKRHDVRSSVAPHDKTLLQGLNLPQAPWMLRLATLAQHDTPNLHRLSIGIKALLNPKN